MSPAWIVESVDVTANRFFGLPPGLEAGGLVHAGPMGKNPCAIQPPSYPCLFKTTEEDETMRLMVPFGAFIAIVMLSSSATAHRSGCHRWHSCPSDSGSYVCGDLGYSNYCPRERAQTTPSPPPISKSTITEIQILLSDLGYDPGPADGVMGSNTRAAVIQFQRRIGLSPDGRVSYPLLLELRKEARK